MAIVKEDGSGLATANVYADVADLDSYASLRNKDLTSYTLQQKEAALFISAQDWVDGKHEFKGYPINATQGMKAPTTEIPLPNDDFVTVNCYTAILQLEGLLFAPSSPADRVKRKKSKLDVLETETEYFEDISSEPDTSIADNMLNDYVTSGGTGNMGKAGC